MKKVFLLMVLCLSLISFVSFSQNQHNNTVNYEKLTHSQKREMFPFKHMISLSPTHLAKGLRISYEGVVSKRSTVGTFLTYDYAQIFSNVTGFTIAPIYRVYFTKTAPKGFYFQPKLLIGFNSLHYTDSKLGSQTANFTTYGGGASFGFQTLFGKKDNWSFNFSMGVKLVTGVPYPKDSYLEEVSSFTDAANWTLVGAGSIADFNIGFGVRF